MNIYRLDSKQMDEAFLKGEDVLCEAAVAYKDLSSGMMGEGERIVIALSNGKKYMGKIKGFEYTLVNEVAVGKLKVIRYPAP